MHVYIDAAFLPKLLSPTPKVFISGEGLMGGLEILTSGPLGGRSRCVARDK